MAAVENLTSARGLAPQQEVIDVDLLDDDIGTTASINRPPTQRRPFSIPYGTTGNSSSTAGPSTRTVIVIDSDDEQPLSSTSSTTTSGVYYDFCEQNPVLNDLAIN